MGVVKIEPYQGRIPNYPYEGYYPKKEDDMTTRELLQDIKHKIDYGKGEKETEKKKKPFAFPFKWKHTMNKSVKAQKSVLVFFLNRLGKIENPKLLPIIEGNIVMIRGVPYDAHPKALWTMGKYKVLIIREIDIKPVGVAATSGEIIQETDDTHVEAVSNQDYEIVKDRGHCTDNIAFMIKLAMRAIQLKPKPKVNKIVIILIILGVVALAIYFFSRMS
jgi:hypothetical protein